MSLVGRTVGNYVLEAKLGEGGMGTVYLGRHPLIGKGVAIKVMRSALVGDDVMGERFFSEACAVNAIRHPNIVDILDFGRADSLLYFTMELLDGESLADRLLGGSLPVEDAQRIARQCCAALQASHAQGIIHRDIKPENIFLCRRGADRSFVKLLDFGLAKLPAGAKVFQTGVDQIFGTPIYMSPEQCEGAARADTRSDVYSLGVVLYEMLAGRPPFQFATAGETMIAHLTLTPKPPSSWNYEVPPELDALVLRALEKRPEVRFQSMAVMLAALDTCSHARGRGPATDVQRAAPRGPAPTATTAATATTQRLLERSRGKRAWVAPAALAVAATLIGAGAYELRRPAPQPGQAQSPRAPEPPAPIVVPPPSPVEPAPAAALLAPIATAPVQHKRRHAPRPAVVAAPPPLPDRDSHLLIPQRLAGGNHP